MSDINKLLKKKKDIEVETENQKVSKKSLEDRVAELEAFVKENKESLSEVNAEVDVNALSTIDLFNELIRRVRDERAERIISLAKQEYQELSKRVTEEVARREVGLLLKEVIEQKLIAAQGVSKIPK